MILFTVWRKTLISSLRGEYVDFIISRFTFTFFTMATALVLYRLKGGEVTVFFINSTGSGGYLGFMIVGTALYGTTHGILLNVSRTLMTERREGTLEAILIIPFSRLQYYGGNQLHQLMLSFLDTLLAVFLGLFLGVQFDFSVPAFAAALVQLFLTLYGLALLVSLLMITLRDTFFIQNTILPLVLLTGGYLFPVDALPPPLRAAAEVIPVYRGVEMVRSAVLAGGDFLSSSGFTGYLISLIPGMAMVVTGFLLLPLIERRALENYLS